MKTPNDDHSNGATQPNKPTENAINGIGAALARFALNRPVTIGMVFISMLLFGAVSGKLLPLEKFPGIDIPEMEVEVPYPDATPLNTPGWFDCYDAGALTQALEDGTALAFLGEGNFIYGFDRIVMVGQDGRGYAWHQINPCGEAVYDGDPVPDTCPPPPESN